MIFRIFGISLKKHQMSNLSELLKQEKLAKSVIDSLPTLFYIQRRDGRIIFWNKVVEDVSGYSSEELYEKHYLDFFRDEDKDDIRKINEAGFIKGFSITESVMILKNGSTKNVLITAKKFKHNKLDYIVGIVSDITSRVEAENKLKIALKEINKLKEDLQKENIYLREEIESEFKFEEIISKSKIIQKIFMQIGQVAQTDASILIQGETGTGKELIARAIHKLSNRGNKPMIKLNCATIPAPLLESELFGHEKGAFTGAIKQKLGRFEIANGGTLFLDEIGELPLELQPKLLRVLQDGEFERIGGNKTIKSDVRIITATNRNLKAEVQANKFRSDLFFRINVFPVNIPPLRDRIEDIPLLVEYFLSKYNIRHNKNIIKIPASAIKRLTSYNWPGNIRELQNILERAIIITKGETLQIEDLLPSEYENNKKVEKQKYVISLKEHEKTYILEILEKTHWRIRGENGAAKLLDIKPTTLDSRMKKLGISRNKL